MRRCNGAEVRSGACCFANGSCLVLTSEACADGDGQHQGDDADCADVDIDCLPDDNDSDELDE